MVQLIALIVLLALNFWFKNSVEKKSQTSGNSSDKLASKEKLFTWILSLINPIITGLVLYYGWKKKLPVKAKQANQITLWAFLIDLIVGITLALTFSH